MRAFPNCDIAITLYCHQMPLEATKLTDEGDMREIGSD